MATTLLPSCLHYYHCKLFKGLVHVEGMWQVFVVFCYLILKNILKMKYKVLSSVSTYLQIAICTIYFMIKSYPTRFYHLVQLNIRFKIVKNQSTKIHKMAVFWPQNCKFISTTGSFASDLHSLQQLEALSPASQWLEALPSDFYVGLSKGFLRRPVFPTIKFPVYATFEHQVTSIWHQVWQCQYVLHHFLMKHCVYI